MTRKPYPSDVSDEEWALVAPHLALLLRRWLAERSFARATRFRCLARDAKRLPETVCGLHFVAFAVEGSAFDHAQASRPEHRSLTASGSFSTGAAADFCFATYLGAIYGSPAQSARGVCLCWSDGSWLRSPSRSEAAPLLPRRSSTTRAGDSTAAIGAGVCWASPARSPCTNTASAKARPPDTGRSHPGGPRSARVPPVRQVRPDEPSTRGVARA